jgi:hypothetical protein
LTFFKDDRNMSTQEIVYHKNARMIWFAIDRHLEFYDVNFLLINWSTLLSFSFYDIIKLIGNPRYLGLLSNVYQSNPLSSPQDHFLFFLEAHMALDLCQLTFPFEASQNVWRTYNVFCKLFGFPFKNIIASSANIWSRIWVPSRRVNLSILYLGLKII